MPFYSRLSDDQLLQTELDIDDPEKLPGLVDVIPDGPEEVYVEFSYDLNGAGRDEMLQCVHGHHRHLKGFVLRKGQARFLVGHICAKEIYGFSAFKADFDAARDRRGKLIHRRDIADQLAPLLDFVRNEITTETLESYDTACARLRSMPAFVTDRAPYFPEDGYLPRAIHAAALGELTDLDGRLRSAEVASEIWKRVPQWLPAFERQIERVIIPLDALVTFLQPAKLTDICDYANKHDMSPKRRYEAGLMTLTCHRQGKDAIVVTVPSTYRVPSKERLATLIRECAQA